MTSKQPTDDRPLDAYVRVSAVGERGGDESYGSPIIQEEAECRSAEYKGERMTASGSMRTSPAGRGIALASTPPSTGRSGPNRRHRRLQHPARILAEPPEDHIRQLLLNYVLTEFERAGHDGRDRGSVAADRRPLRARPGGPGLLRARRQAQRAAESRRSPRRASAWTKPRPKTRRSKRSGHDPRGRPEGRPGGLGPRRPRGASGLAAAEVGAADRHEPRAPRTSRSRPPECSAITWRPSGWRRASSRRSPSSSKLMPRSSRRSRSPRSTTTHAC
jgi:hypothetical protein